MGSGYLKHEFEGFQINPDEKRERFDESLDIILEAWNGKRFSFHGRYNDISNVQLNTVPIQKPHPTVAIAILRNEAAKHVAARGMPVMMIPYATTEHISELAETIDVYNRSFVSSPLDPGEQSGTDCDHGSPRAIFALHTHCADSSDRAVSEAQEPMDRYVRTRLYAKQRSFQLLDEKNLIAVGDPDKVTDTLKIYEQAGLTDFLAINNFGGLPHGQVLSSMRMLAEQVMPSFQTGTHKTVM